MINKYRIYLTLYSLLLSPLLFISSCSSTKNSVYFADLDSTKVNQIVLPKFEEPLIQKDDLLSISIQTIDPTSAAALNQTPAMAGGGANPTLEMTGFLVDDKGNVEIPMLGILKVSGLTTSQAKEVVRARASIFYKNPTIQVRFANYRITVLGEVTRPASYTVPNEKVSILDVISLAGDLTIYGKRENILLIRENGDHKEIVRLNLNSSKLISSPYFYLKQNDVIYVEPNKAKIASNDAPRTQLITIGISVLTLLVAIVSRF